SPEHNASGRGSSDPHVPYADLKIGARKGRDLKISTSGVSNNSKNANFLRLREKAPEERHVYPFQPGPEKQKEGDLKILNNVKILRRIPKILMEFLHTRNFAQR